MSEMSSLELIKHMISKGDVDGHFSEIYAAIKRRQTIRDLEAVGTFQELDEVEFTKDDDWQGVTAQVKKVNAKTLLVELTIDQPIRVGRRVLRPGSKWNVRPTSVRKVS